MAAVNKALLFPKAAGSWQVRTGKRSSLTPIRTNLLCGSHTQSEQNLIFEALEKELRHPGKQELHK